MRTAAGTDCEFYYEDLHRGAERRECRAPRVRGSLPWRPADCERCVVPEVLLRAGSPDLGVRIAIRALPFGLARSVRVECWCERHMLDVTEPLRGCPACRSDTEAILRASLGIETDQGEVSSATDPKSARTPSD